MDPFLTLRLGSLQGSYAFAYEGEEAEEEEVDMYLDGLKDLRRDADRSLHAHQVSTHGPATRRSQTGLDLDGVQGFTDQGVECIGS